MRMYLFRVFLMVGAVLSVSIAGCSSDSTDMPTNKVAGMPPSSPGAENDDPSHPTEGPHGGHLIELGNEEYHAELLHKDDTKTVTVYVLDGHAEQAVAIPQAEIVLQLFRDGQFEKYALQAVQEPTDAADAASRFEIVDTALCDALMRGDNTRGRIQVTIDGKPYVGSIDHTSHDGEDRPDRGP